MVILGVDPGSNVTGYGIINSNGEENTLIESGVIEPDSHTALPERLREIFEGLVKVIEDHRPRQFAIEQAFYSKNAKSALIMGQARGVAILAASKSGIPIGEYSPKEVKCAIVGTGNASKSQVQFMVKKLLRLKEPPEPLDASDALAVALCHAQRARRDLLLSGRASER
ncbi:MAG: crossover junction endodeoxyribonuclease RuvC [Candidatus Zixiibacteriota bacterium]|nr:MAG: crossover junction endodeoxyribonuclease RuvC [candidate division Zixibacteria bacterium]